MSPSNSSKAELSTLWLGNCERHWTKPFIQEALFGEALDGLSSVKLVQDRNPGGLGFAFLNFESHTSARQCLERFQGMPIPDTPDKLFHLNWGNKKTQSGDTASGQGPDLSSIFVGDLAADINHATLLTHFRQRYPSAYHSRVVYNRATGISQGYGFIYFSDPREAVRAIEEMKGEVINGRAIRTHYARSRNQVVPFPRSHTYPPPTINPGFMPPMMNGYHMPSFAFHPAGYTPPMMFAPTSGWVSDYPFCYDHIISENGNPRDSPPLPNLTVFVGNLDTSVTQEQLLEAFAAFGTVTSVRIPPGKGIGFVAMADPNHAAMAIAVMHGAVFAGRSLRCDWGNKSVLLNGMHPADLPSIQQPYVMMAASSPPLVPLHPVFPLPMEPMRLPSGPPTMHHAVDAVAGVALIMQQGSANQHGININHSNFHG